MPFVYHLTTRAAAQEGRQSGAYRPTTLAHEGFIHMSQRHQIVDVANAYFPEHPDLVVLVIDISRLQSDLKYEVPIPPAGCPPIESEDLFPHLYGPLNFDAVTDVVDLPVNQLGTFELPVDLP